MIAGRNTMCSMFTRSILAILSLAIAGCGGQPIGDSGTAAPTPDESVTCTTLDAPAPGYGVGVCASTSKESTVFVASTTTVAPTSADPAAPNYTLSLDAAAAASETSSVAFTAANLAAYSRQGAYNGVRLSKQIGTTATDLAEMTDFHSSSLNNSTTTTITYGSFGTWSRYTTTLQGYEGVWFAPLGDQTKVKVPTSGSVALTGIAVGQIVPANATTGGKVQGLSAQLTLSINYITGAVTGTLTNFMSSVSGTTPAAAGLVSLPITGTLNLVAPLNISGALVANANGTSAGTGDGVLEGLLVGTASLDVTQVVGRLRFNTTDNRRVLMAFGAK